MNAIVSRRLGFKVHILERSEPDALESKAGGFALVPKFTNFSSDMFSIIILIMKLRLIA